VFNIRYFTELHPPDETVTLRSDRHGWQLDEPGQFLEDAWVFTVEAPAGPFTFKLLLDGNWMDGPNIEIDAADDSVVDFNDQQIKFSPQPAVITENGRLQAHSSAQTMTETTFMM